MASYILLSFLLTAIMRTTNAQLVDCSEHPSECECPVTSTGETCILDCDDADICKHKTLTCRSGDKCIIKCEASSACKDGTTIDAQTATDVTIICDGDDACKTDIDIICGTGDCQLQCQTDKSCIDWGDIDVTLSTSFQCTGHCPQRIPALFTKSPTNIPTVHPTHITISPTSNPTASTSNPSISPTLNPSVTTQNPTYSPTHIPTTSPTSIPTINPTPIPTYTTNIPSTSPTKHPIETAVPQSMTTYPDYTINPLFYVIIISLLLTFYVCCLFCIWVQLHRKHALYTKEQQRNSVYTPSPIQSPSKKKQPVVVSLKLSIPENIPIPKPSAIHSNHSIHPNKQNQSNHPNSVRIQIPALIRGERKETERDEEMYEKQVDTEPKTDIISDLLVDIDESNPSKSGLILFPKSASSSKTSRTTRGSLPAPPPRLALCKSNGLGSDLMRSKKSRSSTWSIVVQPSLSKHNLSTPMPNMSKFVNYPLNPPKLDMMKHEATYSSSIESEEGCDHEEKSKSNTETETVEYKSEMTQLFEPSFMANKLNPISITPMSVNADFDSTESGHVVVSRLEPINCVKLEDILEDMDDMKMDTLDDTMDETIKSDSEYIINNLCSPQSTQL